jgi:hypothetical protein
VVLFVHDRHSLPLDLEGEILPLLFVIGEENAGISEGTMHSNWSSPAVATLDGNPTIFYGGADGLAYSFDAEPVEDEEGFLAFPENWRIDCNPPEYCVDEDGKKKKNAIDGGPSEIIGKNVIHDGYLYAAMGQDHEHRRGVGMLSCITTTAMAPKFPSHCAIYEAKDSRRVAAE